MAVTFHIDEKEMETSVDFGRDRIMIQLPQVHMMNIFCLEKVKQT